MTNIEFADALRQVADFYEAHPDLKQVHFRMGIYCHDREDFLKTAMTLKDGGQIQKWADDINSSWPQYHAVRNFGGIELDASIDRKQVCRLVRPAEYECPDSLLEEAKEYTEA